MWVDVVKKKDCSKNAAAETCRTLGFDFHKLCLQHKEPFLICSGREWIVTHKSILFLNYHTNKFTFSIFLGGM